MNTNNHECFGTDLHRLLPHQNVHPSSWSRSFLSLSANTALSIQHISTCLATAYSLIDLTCSAFTHRIYFRTWWYNATHTFYASPIILYLLLLLDRREIVSAASLHMEELSSDIQKSLQVLHAWMQCRFLSATQN
jgi:hypothetical protein